MKSINTTLIVATIVLGLGTINSASANNSSIEESLKKVIVNQSKQVTANLTEKLSASIKTSLSQMATTKVARNHKGAMNDSNKLAKQTTNKSNITAEEE